MNSEKHKRNVANTGGGKNPNISPRDANVSNTSISTPDQIVNRKSSRETGTPTLTGEQQAAVAAKNLTATAIEAAANRVSGGRMGRTKASLGLGKGDRTLLKAAWGDFANVQEGPPMQPLRNQVTR